MRCKHLLPAFVVLLHCTIMFSPLALVMGNKFGEVAMGGLQILQGASPKVIASLIEICFDTLFTILQVAK